MKRGNGNQFLAWLVCILGATRESQTDRGGCRQVAGQTFDRACLGSPVGISSRAP
jgi:hypothetical protein